MDSFVPSAGPESEPGFGLLSKCRRGELAAALAQLPAVQLRRLLMHATPSYTLDLYVGYIPSTSAELSNRYMGRVGMDAA